MTTFDGQADVKGHATGTGKGYGADQQDAERAAFETFGPITIVEAGDGR